MKYDFFVNICQKLSLLVTNIGKLHVQKQKIYPIFLDVAKTSASKSQFH